MIGLPRRPEARLPVSDKSIMMKNAKEENVVVIIPEVNQGEFIASWYGKGVTESYEETVELYKKLGRYFVEYNMVKLYIQPKLVNVTVKRFKEQIYDRFVATGKIFYLEAGFSPLKVSSQAKKQYSTFLCSSERENYWETIGGDNSILAKFLLAPSGLVRRSSARLLRDTMQSVDDPGYLFLMGPQSCFLSKRPYTSVAHLRGETFKIVQLTSKEKELARRGKIIRFGDDGFLYPVSRYAEGMKRGVYFDNPKSVNYCGTFYYSEPGSPTFLHFDKYIKARNKYMVALRLLEELDELPHSNPYQHLPQDFFFLSWSEPYIPDEEEYDPERTPPRNWEIEEEEKRSILIASLLAQFKTMTIDGALVLQKDGYYDPGTDVQYWIMHDMDKFMRGEQLDRIHVDPLTSLDDYGNFVNSLYSEEDVFDQAICKAASYLGYEVIFLERMTAMTRLVEEILDTRERKVSLDSLVWAVE